MITSDSHSLDNSDVCAICLNSDAGERGALVKTACKPVAHLFHIKCINDWLSHSLDNRRCVICRQSPLPLVRLLGARIYENEPYCESLPLMACRTGDLDTLQRLLQLDPSLATLEYFCGDADDGVDLLSITAGNGAVACLQALIDAGADPDSARNRDGAAPLHIAAETGQLTSMKLSENADCPWGQCQCSLSKQWRDSAVHCGLAWSDGRPAGADQTRGKDRHKPDHRRINSPGCRRPRWRS